MNLLTLSILLNILFLAITSFYFLENNKQKDFIIKLQELNDSICSIYKSRIDNLLEEIKKLKKENTSNEPKKEVSLTVENNNVKKAKKSKKTKNEQIS